MPRKYRVCEGRTVTLPQGAIESPGDTNMRLDPGAVFTVEDEQFRRYERYFNGRVRAEDLEEVEEHVTSTVEPIAISRPNPDKPMRMDIHAPPEKLGRKDGDK